MLEEWIWLLDLTLAFTAVCDWIYKVSYYNESYQSLFKSYLKKYRKPLNKDQCDLPQHRYLYVTVDILCGSSGLQQRGAATADSERAPRPEVVLDLLQRAPASLRDTHSCEEQAQHTHHGEEQVGHVQAVVQQVCEGVSERERSQPAHRDTQS